MLSVIVDVLRLVFRSNLKKITACFPFIDLVCEFYQ